MSKIIPPAEFAIEITPTSASEVLKKVEATKASNVYLVDPTKLEIMQDFNVRVRSTDEWEEQVKGLMDSIRANGYDPAKPIAVVADRDEDGEHLWVIDGHTRLEAVYRLIANENLDLDAVPVVVKPKTTTMDDMLVQLVTSNTGKPLTAYETAIVVKRLMNLGKNDTEIATRLGMSKTHVGNLAVLAGAPAKIRNAVIAGKMSATEAVRLVREHGGKATEIVEKATEAAKAAGKTKVTPKMIAAVSGDPPSEKKPRAKKDAAPVIVEEKTVDGAPVGLVTNGGEKAVSGASSTDAIDYALDVAADGLAWLRKWRDGDADTLAELEAYVDPNGGL